MTKPEVDDSTVHESDDIAEPEAAVAAPAPDEAARPEPLTIHIGAGVGLAALVLVGALAAGMVFARLNQPPPPVIVAEPPVIGTIEPPRSAASTLGMTRSDDGQLAPGVVLDVSDAGHPLMNASAPEVAGALLDGTPATLSSHVGKPLVVNFWATWCPPCRLEMPWLEEAYGANRDKGLVLLGVDAGEKVAPEATLDLVRDFVSGAGMSFPILMPTDAYKAQYDYQVYGLPSTYFIGRDGKVTDVIRGAFPNKATLEARVAEYWRAWDASAP